MNGYEMAIKAMEGPASVSVRLNPFKPVASPENSTAVPWCEYGHILSQRPNFTLDPLFHAGAYYVQDSSAMFVGHLFRCVLKDFGPGVRVLDLCAAPGGKTTDLAASLRLAFGDDFTLVSNEVMRQRASVLSDNVAMWGDPNVIVTSVDPKAFARLEGCFDIIVADVPCSGEGMFRKDVRAYEEWSEENVHLCEMRQRRIIADVWPALRDGGAIIYSTCTFEDCENDGNVRWIADELCAVGVPSWDPGDFKGVKRTQTGHLLVPGDVPGEGQFAAALRKEGGPERSQRVDFKVLHPLRLGLRKGETKGHDFIPDADYALSLSFDRSEYPCVEVDLATALSFLHRDTIVLRDAPRGFLALTYSGIPIGFVKNIGNRCNNMHPLSRRILMDINRL